MGKMKNFAIDQLNEDVPEMSILARSSSREPMIVDWDTDIKEIWVWFGVENVVFPRDYVAKNKEAFEKLATTIENMLHDIDLEE